MPFGHASGASSVVMDFIDSLFGKAHPKLFSTNSAVKAASESETSQEACAPEIVDIGRSLEKRDASLALEQHSSKAASSARIHGQLQRRRGRQHRFRPSVRQLGDSVGMKDAGRNYVLHFGLRNPRLWCKDPRLGAVTRAHMPLLPKTVHPSLKLAFNAKEINIHLTDMGTAEKPDDKDIYDADFAVDKSRKEIASDAEPDGGEIPQMEVICPKPGEVHRYELTVSGLDHRANPPDHTNRGLQETVMFEGELRRLGTAGVMHARSGEGSEVNQAGLHKYRPVVESNPGPLLSAQLGHPLCIMMQYQMQEQRLRRFRRSKTFLLEVV